MKPEFMRLRRAFAGALAALLMAVGIVVLSPALSASAHHNTITASASCENYVWTITWTVTNSERDKTETVTSSTDQAVIPTGTTIAAGGSYTSQEVVSGPIDKSLTVSAKWSNNVTNTARGSISKSDFHGTCEQDNPQLNASANGCVAYGTTTGTVNYTLSGVRSSYTIALLKDGTAVQSTRGGAGTGHFDDVAPGLYTVKANSSSGSVETQQFRVVECAPNEPVIALVVAPCVSGGSLGAVTANLSNLNIGVSYRLALRSADGTVLQARDILATSATATSSFDKRGAGTYYVTVAIGNGSVLESSAHATIRTCTRSIPPTIIVNLEPCATPSNGLGLREISATVDGLTPSTAYTVQLVTADAAATVVASTTSPGGAETTFTHLFTGVPSPGDYRVTVSGSTTQLMSDPIAAAVCDLDTLAPPEVEVAAPQCDNVNSPAALTAKVINLDATRTYYVRIVDSQGTVVSGGQDKSVTGSTSASVTFPAVPVPGTYSAQLLIDPGKQLAATSPAAVNLSVCLPTLAMTGPGALIPLGSVAALLLTLGGAVVTGRLRRRMAL